jgi:hypothetical protein
MLKRRYSSAWFKPDQEHRTIYSLTNMIRTGLNYSGLKGVSANIVLSAFLRINGYRRMGRQYLVMLSLDKLISIT